MEEACHILFHLISVSVMIFISVWREKMTENGLKLDGSGGSLWRCVGTLRSRNIARIESLSWLHCFPFQFLLFLSILFCFCFEV